jgi:hypothetical protein
MTIPEGVINAPPRFYRNKPCFFRVFCGAPLDKVFRVWYTYTHDCPATVPGHIRKAGYAKNGVFEE